MNEDSKKAVESVEYLKSYCMNTRCDECVFHTYNACWFKLPPCFWKNINVLTQKLDIAETEKP